MTPPSSGAGAPFSEAYGHLVQVPVEHQPWPVHAATLVGLEESVTTAAGLPVPDGEPLVHYSPGVDARFGPPRRATRAQ